MRKSLLAALAVLMAAVPLLFLIPVNTLEAQNVGFAGRWPSDAGNPVYGYGTATDTTAKTMAAAAGANNANYIYWASCVNTSASTVSAGLIKGGTTTLAVISCPAASAYSQPIVFYPPIRAGNNVAVTIEATASATTMYFSMGVRTARYQ